MLEPPNALLKKAVIKTSKAYGAGIKKDLNRPIERLIERPRRLEECMDALKIDGVSKGELWKKIRRLSFKE